MNHNTTAAKTIVLACLLLASQTGLSQNADSKKPFSTTNKQPEAVSIVVSALQRAGVARPLSPSIVAEGVITYFWAGKRVDAPAHIHLAPDGTFKFETDVSDSPRSLDIDSTGPRFREGSKGQLLSLQCVRHYTLFFWPYTELQNAVSDPTVSIQTVSIKGHQSSDFLQVRLTYLDSDAVDYFFSRSSLTLVGIGFNTPPENNATARLRHDFYFAGWRLINGVVVPTAVREAVGGQTTWSLELNEIRFGG